jgi:hypothetical protein
MLSAKCALLSIKIVASILGNSTLAMRPGMAERLTFTKNGKDITEGIDLRNGKANPFGWSTYEVWLTEPAGMIMDEHKIADLYCGEVKNLAEGYSFRIEKDAAHG